MNQVIKDLSNSLGNIEKGLNNGQQHLLYDSAEKDKGKYIGITCMHTPIEKDTTKNNYNVHVRIFLGIMMQM